MRLLGKKLSGVVGTVMTNMGMEVALRNQGYELVRAKVGDRYVVEELFKTRLVNWWRSFWTYTLLG